MNLGHRIASRWFLEAKIGEGGMAEVFRVRAETALGVSIVRCVKVLLPAFVTDETIVRKAIDEGRLGVMLTNAGCPNIVAVQGHGIEGGRPWILMEYVDGIDCSCVVGCEDVIRDPSWIAVVAHIGRRVLEALRFAHRLAGEDGAPLGVVHRDISPHNIFLGRNGTVKLGDFGVARSSVQSQLTTAGTAPRGKIGYMPPEQLQGGIVDASTDLFALGVTLFELLTGERPFVGRSVLQIEAAMKDGDRARLRDLRPDVPEAMEAVIDRMLVPVRVGRFADHAEGIRTFLNVEAGHDVDGAIRRVVERHPSTHPTIQNGAGVP